MTTVVNMREAYAPHVCMHYTCLHALYRSFDVLGVEHV
jgi:hypothetical protein